jgi:ABC-2 type transport system permease protein
MTRTIRSELRKLLSTRTAIGMLGAAIAFTSLLVFGAASAADPEELTGVLADQPFDDIALIVVSMTTLVLGIRSFTDEFRHGSIVPTLLASPARRRVLAAKLVVMAGAAIVMAVVVQSAAIALGAWIVAGKVGALTVSIGSVASGIGLGALTAVLWSALGVGIGLAVRHQVAAIAGSLVTVLVAENLVGGFLPEIGSYLPMHAAGAINMGQSGVEGFLDPLTGGLVLAAWTTAAVVIGVVAMGRRDIA